jgi:hypothetical protein
LPALWPSADGARVGYGSSVGFDLPFPRLWVEETSLWPTNAPVGAHKPASCQAPQPSLFSIAPASCLQPSTQYGLPGPFLKMSQWWIELTGYAYNPATLTTTQTVVREQLESVEENSKARLIAAPVYNFDKTGVRVDDKLHWLHRARPCGGLQRSVHVSVCAS